MKTPTIYVTNYRQEYYSIWEKEEPYQDLEWHGLLIKKCFRAAEVLDYLADNFPEETVEWNINSKPTK